MEIDIRPQPKEPITKIRFADDSVEKRVAVSLELGKERIFITGTDGEESLVILSRDHVANLIKALGKAFELMWPLENPRGK